MSKISAGKKIVLIIFGLFLCILLLEIGLRVGGSMFLFFQEYKNRNTIRQKGSYRIMCLGESTTALGDNNSYPRQLEEILNQRDIGIKFGVINKGVPGANTGDIVEQLEYNLDKYVPDMVIAMMGINDTKDVKVYESILQKKVLSFFRSLRIYELGKLLWLHISSNTGETRTDMPSTFIMIDGLGQPVSIDEDEKEYRKKIELNPKNDGAYSKLGWCYKERAKYHEPEEIIEENGEKKLGNNIPSTMTAYNMLEWRCFDKGEYEENEKIVRKIIELNPENDEAYVDLGQWYITQGEYGKSEKALKRAIELNPKNNRARTELKHCYWHYKNYDTAEKMFKKAIELNPENEEAFIGLGACCRDKREYDEAEEMYKRAIDINPENDMFYVGLAWVYKDQRMFDKAIEMLEIAVEINSNNDEIDITLAHCYKGLGKFKLAEEHFQKASRIRLRYYNPVTRYNYQKLKEIARKRGVKLVCVEYPLRSVESLKNLLGSEGTIIFVDNGELFKEVLKQANYNEYFTDMFGGDFGHCTPKGNRLLAENVANVILKEIFNQ